MNGNFIGAGERRFFLGIAPLAHETGKAHRTSIPANTDGVVIDQRECRYNFLLDNNSILYPLVVRFWVVDVRTTQFSLFYLQNKHRYSPHVTE